MADGGAAVIGIGNPLRADDGAGAEVVRRLAGRVPPEVRLLALSGEPAELLDAWDGLDAVVVVDAVRTGGTPGMIHRLDASDTPLAARTGSPSTHGLGLAEALELGRALGRLPARVIVVGIEAGDDSDGDVLSAPVEDAIDEAAALVVSALTPNGDSHA